jgi:hypothetical protein
MVYGNSLRKRHSLERGTILSLSRRGMCFLLFPLFHQTFVTLVLRNSFSLYSYSFIFFLLSQWSSFRPSNICNRYVVCIIIHVFGRYPIEHTQ